MKCTPAQPVLPAHDIPKSGLSADLRQRSNPGREDLSHSTRAGTVSVAEELGSKLSLGYSECHSSEGELILACPKVTG